jgi:hypothetical protein
VELEDFKFGLRPFYNFPDQLIFVNETSKDGRDAIRKYAWAPIGSPAIVSLPFSRGQRVSALAAFNSIGFLAWPFTTGIFTRQSFHNAFINTILPHLHPWPMPNSIVIIDNTRIHMYKQLQDAIETRGALLFLFFTSIFSSPQSHQNRVFFGQEVYSKKWLPRFPSPPRISVGLGIQPMHKQRRVSHQFVLTQWV